MASPDLTIAALNGCPDPWQAVSKKSNPITNKWDKRLLFISASFDLRSCLI
jgi:hypothetical protein